MQLLVKSSNGFSKGDLKLIGEHFFDYTLLKSGDVRIDITNINEFNELSYAFKCPVEYIGMPEYKDPYALLKRI